MKFKVIPIAAVILFLTVSGVLGQSISLDGVTGLYNTDTLEVNQMATFNIRITNNTANNYGGITNGFRIYTINGAEWTQTTVDTISWGWPDMFNLIYTIVPVNMDGLAADTFGFGGSRISSTGLPAGFDEIVYTATIGPIPASSHRKTICIDSSFFPNTGKWLWASPVANPNWDGPHCFRVFDPNAPTESNLVLSLDSIHFTVVEDDPPPTLQQFEITSDNIPVTFNLTETSSWIVPSPVSGTTPRTITVQINNIGLTAGSYLDSIEVTSNEAVNGPFWVMVSLEVEPKPPEIGFTPNSVVFNAVAGEANPADKIVNISNLGGLPLNWTLTNSSGWLSYTPTSGTNSESVTLSADLTGLAFGEYDDTIVITDPNAINNPQILPVHLSVSSDLPLIALDSTIYHLISTPNNPSPATVSAIVLNGGAGVMNYWVEETSTRIDSVVPSAGAAPETVTIYFDLTGTVAGLNYYDTLWVHSNEAANSPQALIVEEHIVNIPAEIIFNKDSTVLHVYECAFGLHPRPEAIFSIANVSNAEPLNYQIEYESEYFTLNVIDVGNWDEVHVIAANSQLPIGTYYDTIIVTSQVAINSPQLMFIRYVIRETFETPEIFITENSFVFVTQENEGPIFPKGMIILNQAAGCMEWFIDESVPWLTAVPDTGNVPAGTRFFVDAVGLTLGEYSDSLFIVAPEASNSPQKIDLIVKVWKLHGDFNFDGQLDIVDLILFTEYMFNFGVGPYPELRVGDLTCDGQADLVDLLYFVEYAFNFGPPPCGNPY